MKQHIDKINIAEQFDKLLYGPRNSAIPLPNPYYTESDDITHTTLRGEKLLQ